MLGERQLETQRCLVVVITKRLLKGQVVEAYTELFTFDVDDTKLNPIEIKEQIDQLVQNLANAIGEEDWEDLKIRLGFSFVDDDASNYEKELPKINAASSIRLKYRTSASFDYDDFFYVGTVTSNSPYINNYKNNITFQNTVLTFGRSKGTNFWDVYNH